MLADLVKLTQQSAQKLDGPSPQTQQQIEIVQEFTTEENQVTFDELYTDYSHDFARTVSTDERHRESYTCSSLSYGEISFIAMNALFGRLHEHGFESINSTFLDVGAGSGKPVISAVLSGEFTECIGIEILSGLHGICTAVHDKWKRMCYKKKWRARTEIEITFLCGDALVMEWSKVDVVFAHVTCFGTEMMTKLKAKLDNLRPGSFVITISKCLVSDSFNLLENFDIDVSWGMATLYIYRRNSSQPSGRMSDKDFLKMLKI